LSSFIENFICYSAGKRWKEGQKAIPIRNYANMVLEAKNRKILGREEQIGKYTLY